MKKSIYVELIKIIKKRSFIVFLLILLIICPLLTIFVNNPINTYCYETSSSVINNLCLENNIIDEYIISNNIDLSINNNLSNVYILMLFVNVFVVVIASNSFGKEYEKKTIKNIMLNNKKSEVVFSKLISLVLISFIMYLFIYLINLITVYIINDFSLSDIVYYIYRKGKIIEKSYIIKHTCEYFINILPFLIIISLGVLLSIILKGSSIPIVCVLFISVMSSFITDLFIKLKIYLIKYSFIPYLDLTIFNNKINVLIYNLENNMNLNIWYGIFIILISFIIMNIISLLIFKKREYK